MKPLDEEKEDRQDEEIISNMTPVFIGVERYFALVAEVESLKAITELAIKGLEWYADIVNHLELVDGRTEVSIEEGRKARTIIYEIERLQNGTP